MPRVATHKITYGNPKGINEDTIYKFSNGFPLSNLPKKENDLYHLLNLACLKLTGQQLPADGLPANLWSYVSADSKRLGISPKYEPETIMRPCYFSDLSFAVKRALISDEIKCIQHNSDKLENNFKGLQRLGIPIRYGSNSHTTIEEFKNGSGFQYDEMEEAVIKTMREQAYDCLVNCEENSELTRLIRDSQDVLTPYDNGLAIGTAHRIDSWTKKFKWFGQVFQNSSFQQRRYRGRYGYSGSNGSRSKWEMNNDINASKRIDKMFLRTMKDTDGVGKEFTITRQQKIRKGKEGKMFDSMMKCLPYVWANGHISNLSQQVIQNNFSRRCWMKNSISGCFGMGLADSGMIKPDGSIDHFKLGWSEYKKDSGNLSSNDLIRVLCGKKGYTDEISIKNKMVKMFC